MITTASPAPPAATLTPGEEVLSELRMRMIVASRAAGLEPPIDTVWIHLQDADALRRSCAWAARDACASTPTGWWWSTKSSRRVPQRSSAPSGLSRLSGRPKPPGWRRVDGVFVDYPIVYRARRTPVASAAIRARKHKA